MPRQCAETETQHCVSQQASLDLAGDELQQALMAVATSVSLDGDAAPIPAAIHVNSTCPVAASDIAAGREEPLDTGAPALRHCGDIQVHLDTVSADAFLALCRRQLTAMAPQLAGWGELHTAVATAHARMRHMARQLDSTQASADVYMTQAARLSTQRAYTSAGAS